MASTEMAGTAGEPAPKRLKLSPPPSTTNSTTTDPNYNNNNNLDKSSGNTDIDIAMAHHAKLHIKNQISMEQTREVQSGILCFVSESTTGFSGILKQRYTDFLVNEITPDGKVAHLTDTKAPKLPELNVQKPVPVASSETVKHTPEVRSEQISENKESSTAAPTSASNLEASEPVPVGTTQVNGRSSETTALTDVTSDKSLKPKPTISAEDIALLDSLINTEIRESAVRMYEKMLEQPDSKPSIFGILYTKPIDDKDIRTQIHKEFRRIFDSRFETVAAGDGTVSIRAAARRQLQPRGTGPDPRDGRGGRQQTKGKLGWMELGGEYLHFSLYKENKDTMEVLGFLSARLKMKPGSFSFSGTKDRRAVTVQRVSTYRMRAETLANLSKSLYGSMLGDFKYERYNLDLGDLAGNEFLITLRDVTVDDPAFENLDLVHRVSMVKQVVGEAVRNLQQNGFINYFGLQRFGSYEIGTDDVGKKILQGDFKAAVDGILYVKPEVMAEVQLKGNNSTLPRDELARARAIDHFLTTGRSHQALQILPKRFNGERFIMSHLDQRAKENDFVGALLRIPRNLRLMYVHAYQSLVWNMVASERWTRHGKKVVKGDLVLINPKESKNGVTQKQEEIDESGEVIVRPDVLDSAVSHADAFERARALTQEEAESGKYTIYDIVLPTPGFDIEYPDNEIGDFYRDFMASDRGGGLHPGNMRRQQKDFSLSGSYRKFMAAIGKDCSYDIQTYDDDEQQLVETDLEKLCKLDPNHPTGKNNNSGHNGQNGQNKKPQISFKQHGKEIDEKDLTEEALSAAESTKRVEQHNAWKNLPSVLEAEDKASATEREAKDTVDAEKSRVKVMTLPSFKETYIQTEPDRFSRTGHRETVLVGAADATADGKEPRAIAAVAVESQVEAKGQSTMEPLTTDPVTGTKRPREESLRPSSTIVPGEAATGVKVQAQAEFPKIAAIIKFQLGSSQYATMALRELMKRGGVTTYKPEFSSTR